MTNAREGRKRIMVKEPLTIESLTKDLSKVFTDELEVYGNEYKPIAEPDVPVILNSGLEARVPVDAQRLLYLANQYESRQEVLRQDIEDKITEIFHNEILREQDEKLRISKYKQFLETGITSMVEISKLQAYQAREKMLRNIAWLIINEHIGHDPTHRECSDGIGIRKDWAIVKLESNDELSRGEFHSFTAEILKKSGGDDFEGLSDIIID